MPHPERLTTTDAIAYLAQHGITYSIIGMKRRRRVSPDAPRFLKIGGRVFYRQTDLDEFVGGRQ